MIASAAVTTGSATNRRWWLWLPLLAVAAWFAAFGDKSPPDNTNVVSLPTRATERQMAPRLQTISGTPRTTASSAAAAEPLQALIPRERLIAGVEPTSKTEAPARDLFASKNWNPPPPPLPVIEAAPVAPPLPFTYLGKKLEREAWEVYLSRGEQTFIVREGLTFDTAYRVDKISPTSLSLTYLPLAQAQTLSIGDSP